MKFAYAAVIILCLLTSTSWSTSNPLIRNCNLAGGEFTVVEIIDYTAHHNDQWALCKFGAAYVGALDVMFFNTKMAEAKSFEQYSNDAVICKGELLEARVLGATDTFLVCQYDDQTIIDMDTLSFGPYSQANQKLSTYLGL